MKSNSSQNGGSTCENQNQYQYQHQHHHHHQNHEAIIEQIKSKLVPVPTSAELHGRRGGGGNLSKTKTKTKTKGGQQYGGNNNGLPSLVSEEVCCINARSWSSLIAWTEIIGCALGFAVAIVLFENLGTMKYYMNTAEFREGLRNTMSHADSLSDYMFNELVKNTIQRAYLAAMIFAVFVLATSGAGTVMGALLHHGVSREKPLFLSVWMMLSALSIISEVTCAVAILVIADKFQANAVIFIGNVLLNAFCMWIVGKHLSELKEHKARLLSLKQPDPSAFSFSKA